MAPTERKNSTVGIAMAFGVGIGIITELFASSEIPFGTGIIIGGLVGFLFGNFIKMLVMPWRQR
jgi:hypothetical protein